MCTNPRLVNSLECYMDDLVDCFEDFVTKSLVVVSLAIGAVIVMIGYVMKMLNDRTLIQIPPTHHPGSILPEPGLRTNAATLLNYSTSSQSASEETPISDPHLQNIYNENIRKSRSYTIPKPAHGVNMSFVKSDFRNTPSNDDTTGPWTGTSVPNYEERVLRSIGLSSCSENCNRRNLKRHDSSSRVLIRSMPTCFPNHHISPPGQCSQSIQQKTSCCSMCCAEDDRR